MDLLGFGYIDGSTGFDNGADIIYNNIIIDIKTMGRTTEVRDYYVNNFLAIQFKYNTDIYIFCSFNKINYNLTICGWISKNDFTKKAKLFKKGTKRFRSDGSSFNTFHDLYEINNSDLNNINNIEDFIIELNNFKK